MTTAGVRAAATMTLVAGIGLALMTTATPSAADAGHLSVNTGAGWTQQPNGALFDFDGMAPGWSGTSSLALRNDSTETSTLTLTSADIDDDENGCNRPEKLADDSCSGPDAGELGHELVFTVYADDAPATPLWRGSLYDLENGVTLDRRMNAGQVDSYRVESQLPITSGDETETDSVSFSLQLRLAGADAVAVQGVKVTRSPHRGGVDTLIDALPFTGEPTTILVEAALSLLCMGAVLWLLGWLRRPT